MAAISYKFKLVPVDFPPADEANTVTPHFHPDAVTFTHTAIVADSHGTLWQIDPHAGTVRKVAIS